MAADRRGHLRPCTSRAPRSPRRGHRLLAPIMPSKIVAVGLNYKDHAAEVNKPLPAEPLMFLKPSTAVIGPGVPIVIPDGAGRVDHEAEVGVVIGATAMARARAGRARATSSGSPASTTSPRASCRRRTCSTRAPRASTPSRRSARASRPGSTTRTGGTAVEGWVNGDAPAGIVDDARADLPDCRADRVHLVGDDAAARATSSRQGRRRASGRCRPAIVSRSRSRAWAS